MKLGVFYLCCGIGLILIVVAMILIKILGTGPGWFALFALFIGALLIHEGIERIG